MLTIIMWRYYHQQQCYVERSAASQILRDNFQHSATRSQMIYRFYFAREERLSIDILYMFPLVCLSSQADVRVFRRVC